MNSQQILEWKKVIINPNCKAIPSERWGHSIIPVGDKQLVLFGGFGQSSEGRYLDDLWSFNVDQFQWTKVQTTGNKPTKRSNYTIHYDQINRTLIMFGGGSQNKQRFNNVLSLEWDTKIWRQLETMQYQQRPWDRTYHSSVFIYPYLIVFGGESLANTDLNDLWAFNVQEHKWKQINFKENSIEPKKRRFQTSIFLDGYFYVIGGCYGPNYQLTSDIFRVNLSKLLEQQIFQKFEWQCVIENHPILQRWGHQSNLYDNKIYITFGRANQKLDSNQIYVFNPKNKQIKQLAVSKQNQIKARRRHSSVIIGNSLIIFGGYNGNYLKDMYFISLPTNYQKQYNYTVKQMNKGQISNYQNKLNQKIKVNICGKTLNINTQFQKLIKNNYFKNLIQFHNFQKSQDIQLIIPSFVDEISFKVFHTAVCHKQILIQQSFTFEDMIKLFKTLQYFCQKQMIQALQQQFIKRLNISNAMNFLSQQASDHLPLAKKKAAQFIFNVYVEQNDTKNNVKAKSNFNINKSQLLKNLYLQNKNANKKCQQKIQKLVYYLTISYQQKKFEIEQAKMRQQKCGIFTKASNKLKRLFSQQKNDSFEGQNKQKQNGCLKRIVNYFQHLFISSKNQQSNS